MMAEIGDEAGLRKITSEGHDIRAYKGLNGYSPLHHAATRGMLSSLKQARFSRRFPLVPRYNHVNASLNLDVAKRLKPSGTAGATSVAGLNLAEEAQHRI